MLEQLTPYLPQDPLFHSLAILGILAALSILAFLVTEKIIIKLQPYRYICCWNYYKENENKHCSAIEPLKRCNGVPI